MSGHVTETAENTAPGVYYDFTLQSDFNLNQSDFNLLQVVIRKSPVSHIYHGYSCTKGCFCPTVKLTSHLLLLFHCTIQDAVSPHNRHAE